MVPNLFTLCLALVLNLFTAQKNAIISCVLLVKKHAILFTAFARTKILTASKQNLFVVAAKAEND